LIYCCRIILVLVIFVYMLYQIAVFLMGIYISYGNKFYLMSLIPAVIMVLMNFFVINLLMILLSTIIVYKYGLKIDKTKNLNISEVLYLIVVPSHVYAIHQSILNFREFYTQCLKKEQKINAL